MSNIVVEEESGVEIKDFKVQKERKLRLWLFVFLVNCLLSHILHMRVRWIRKICCVIQRIRRVRKLKVALSIHCIYWFGFKIGKIRLLNYRMREGIWPLLFGLLWQFAWFWGFLQNKQNFYEVKVSKLLL